MAYVPMTAGGGGSMTETTLWTNNSPSSGFAAQTVTLSDSIENYDYIKIKYRYNNNTVIDGYAWSKVDDFKTMTGTGTMTFGLNLQHTTGNDYSRSCIYVSNTQVSFTQGWYNNATKSNLVCIPGEIYGVKLQGTHFPSVNGTITKLTEISVGGGASATKTYTLDDNYDAIAVSPYNSSYDRQLVYVTDSGKKVYAGGSATVTPTYTDLHSGTTISFVCAYIQSFIIYGVKNVDIINS